MPVTEEYDPFYNRAKWELKFSFLPRRCDISNKLCWFKYAYQGTAVWQGPGEDAIEKRWHDNTEHLIWKLKGN